MAEKTKIILIGGSAFLTLLIVTASFTLPFIIDETEVAAVNAQVFESSKAAQTTTTAAVTAATTATTTATTTAVTTTAKASAAAATVKQQEPAVTLKAAVTTTPPVTTTVTIPTTKEESGVYIEMVNILQNPELPTGCEIVALTSLLRFYGFNADKIQMAKNYLPISDGNKRTVDGKEYRDSFFTYFIGDPFGNGFGCFSPAIVTAATNYLADNGGGYDIVNISGCEPSDLYDLVAEGTPVMCWATMDMVPSVYRRSWYDNATGEKLDWRINEHALILCGFDKENKTVTVNCSLEGIKEYDMSVFEARFGEMHSQAVYLVKGDGTPKPITTTTTPVTTTPPVTTTTPTTPAPETSKPAPVTTPKPANTDITERFPDPAFRAAIRGVLGISDNAPIMSAAVAPVRKLSISNKNISNLSGIEYFTSLTYLNCNDNKLTSLPELPKGLTVLTVDNNQLSKLPVLPKNLTLLWCDNNQLEYLPELPDTLTELSCAINYLIELPKLPLSLKELYCSDNGDLNILTVIFKDGVSLQKREAGGWFDVIDY
jgi:uncharacterized protein YvpB